MNKFPVWLNTLVLLVLLSGCLFALPNLYGSVDAIQIASNDDAAFTEERLAGFVDVVEQAGVTPEAAYLLDGRVVFRFDEDGEQDRAAAAINEAYSGTANVAKTRTRFTLCILPGR